MQYTHPWQTLLTNQGHDSCGAQMWMYPQHLIPDSPKQATRVSMRHTHLVLWADVGESVRAEMDKQTVERRSLHFHSRLSCPEFCHSDKQSNVIMPCLPGRAVTNYHKFGVTLRDLEKHRTDFHGQKKGSVGAQLPRRLQRKPLMFCILWVVCLL